MLRITAWSVRFFAGAIVTIMFGISTVFSLCEKPEERW
jgi:hypothetical protein